MYYYSSSTSTVDVDTVVAVVSRFVVFNIKQFR